MSIGVRLLLAAALAAVLGLAALYHERIDPQQLMASIDRLGAGAALAFIALYVVATVALLPGSALTLAGGALFGPAWGTLYNLTGATLGAMLAFLAARHIASDWVRERAGARLQRLLDGIDRGGWRFVAFTRLVPLFPFNLLNYALGLTRIGFWPYSLVSFVCMLPATFAYTHLGHAGAEVLRGEEDLVRTLLIALALLASVLFLPRLIRSWRSASTEPPDA